MKTIRPMLLSALVMSILMACSAQNEPFTYEKASFGNKLDHSQYSLDIELPVASSKAASAVREELIRIIDQQVNFPAYREDRTILVDMFTGDKDDINAIVNYYGEKGLEQNEKEAQADYDERMSEIMNNEYLDEEEKEMDIQNILDHEISINISKVEDALNYVVFLSMNSVYLGGAHGGITGDGYLTYSKKDGHLVKEFIKEGCIEEMQPIIVEGLLKYMNDAKYNVSEEELRDFLFIDSELIPLPKLAPCPKEEGLEFTYQEYEIVGYAMGMPSFIISYDKLKPFLTDEAKTLLEIK